MRGTNGPMDVITRAEFDQSMKNFPTKHELVSAVRETIKENLEDLKVDLFAQIEEKVTRSRNLLQLNAVKTSELKDVKNEILATMRRNIGEAIEPLRAELGVVKSDVGGLTSDMTSLKSDVAGLRSDMTSLKSDVTGLKSDVTGLKSDVTSLKSDVAGLKSEMDLGFLKMGSRLDEMKDQIKIVADGHIGLDEKLTCLGDELRERLNRHERILERHDADLYKLRQSGVLQ